jgi:hypothetical protein
MLDNALEILPELVYLAVAGVLTAFGLGVEFLSAQSFSGGELTMGLWFGFIGVVAMYAGLSLAREKALPALRS